VIFEVLDTTWLRIVQNERGVFAFLQSVFGLTEVNNPFLLNDLRKLETRLKPSQNTCFFFFRRPLGANPKLADTLVSMTTPKLHNVHIFRFPFNPLRVAINIVPAGKRLATHIVCATSIIQKNWTLYGTGKILDPDSERATAFLDEIRTRFSKASHLATLKILPARTF
jgi:hypothetical protein